jgi:hypothetical protein
MNKFYIRESVFFGLIVGYFMIWYFSTPENRIFYLFFSIPGCLFAVFEVLWKEVIKLEKKIQNLENKLSQIGGQRDD